MRRIYLNNAATSYPKPRAVVEAVTRALVEAPVEPGRGSGNGRDPLAPCRSELAGLLGVDDPLRVVLQPSATHALNLAIGGLTTEGSHVVTTVLEHNSVLRPLAHAARDRSVSVTHLRPGRDGACAPSSFAEAIGDATRLVVVTHACNVTGAIQPVDGIAEVAAAAAVPLLVDASQSAGAVDLDHARLPGRVFVACAGHKSLLGPQGVGALIVPDSDVPQAVVGGTGVRSESLLHPAELPLRHEAGTPNLPGISGLCAGVREVRRRGVEREGQHRARLVGRLRQGLGAVPGLLLPPLAGDDGRTGIVPFTLDGRAPEELAYALEACFGIETRAGLHCAPLVFANSPIARNGTVRVSVGRTNRDDDVEALIDAVDFLARQS